MSQARGGVRQVVLLSGEPGIGKTQIGGVRGATRLTRMACGHRAGGRARRIWRVPYEPWIGVCSQLVEHAPPDLLKRSCVAARR